MSKYAKSFSEFKAIIQNPIVENIVQYVDATGRDFWGEYLFFSPHEHFSLNVYKDFGGDVVVDIYDDISLDAVANWSSSSRKFRVNLKKEVNNAEKTE
jgi:hypothetical protein